MIISTQVKLTVLTHGELPVDKEMVTGTCSLDETVTCGTMVMALFDNF